MSKKHSRRSQSRTSKKPVSKKPAVGESKGSSQPVKPIFIGREKRSSKRKRTSLVEAARREAAKAPPGSAPSSASFKLMAFFIVGFLILGLGVNSLVSGTAARNGTVSSAIAEIVVGLAMAAIFGTALFKRMRADEIEARKQQQFIKYGGRRFSRQKKDRRFSRQKKDQKKGKKGGENTK